MEQDDILRRTVRRLDDLRLRYLITGSIASMYYGEHRLTNDIDIVIALREDDVGGFLAAFAEPDVYVSEDAVAEAVRRRGQFNVLYPNEGMKIDFMVATESTFDRARLDRANRLPIGDELQGAFA